MLSVMQPIMDGFVKKGIALFFSSLPAWTKEEEKMRQEKKKKTAVFCLRAVGEVMGVFWKERKQQSVDVSVLVSLHSNAGFEENNWEKNRASVWTATFVGDSHSLPSPFFSSTLHLLLFHNSQWRLPVESPKLQIWISLSCVSVFLCTAHSSHLHEASVGSHLDFLSPPVSRSVATLLLIVGYLSSWTTSECGLSNLIQGTFGMLGVCSHTLSTHQWMTQDACWCRVWTSPLSHFSLSYHLSSFHLLCWWAGILTHARRLFLERWGSQRRGERDGEEERDSDSHLHHLREAGEN